MYNEHRTRCFITHCFEPTISACRIYTLYIIYMLMSYAQFFLPTLGNLDEKRNFARLKV